MDWTSRREKWKEERTRNFSFSRILSLWIEQGHCHETRSFSPLFSWTLPTLNFSLISKWNYTTVKLIGKKLRKGAEKKAPSFVELPRAPSARVTPKNRSSASSTCFSNPYALRHDKSIICGREKFGGIAGAVLERMGKIDLAESLGHRDLLIRFTFNLVKFRER